MHIETKPLSSLTPYARNPRKNAGFPVSKVKASLKEFGWQQPIVIDTEGVIIAGHTRYLAAMELGMTEVPVHIATGLTPAQVKAYRIADNRTGQEATWDTELLALEFDDLKGMDFDLALTGFDADELAGIDLEEPATEGDTEPQIDRAEELRVKWGVNSGDLWQLGEHRLLCGDSTKAEDVARVMGGEKAALLWADPPFGIQYSGHGASVDGRANKFAPIAGDDKPRGEWLSFAVPISGGAIYLKSTWSVLHKWEMILSGVADLKSRIVWDKCSHVAGDVLGGYATQSEIVLFAAIGRHKTNKFDSDVWRIPRATTGSPEQRTGHPYESPVELPSRAIENSSQRGNLVYDPFSGSGTTIIACENLGRKCRAIEISPAYVAVALERWATHAGQTPTRV